LWYAEDGHEIAHAQLAWLKKMQDAEARAIGTRAEEAIDRQSRRLKHVLSAAVYGVARMTAISRFKTERPIIRESERDCCVVALVSADGVRWGRCNVPLCATPEVPKDCFGCATALRAPAEP
jgi:hypothetical protein